MPFIGGAVIYNGPSSFSPSHSIATIVTNITRPSANAKTGPMAQCWIIRTDLTPTVARYSPSPSSVTPICGSCPIKSACYVDMKYVDRVYSAYSRGQYESLTPERTASILHRFRRTIRIGAYGDPAAVPIEIWQRLLSSGTGIRHTGYTHAWRTLLSPSPWPQYFMASCEGEEDRRLAQQLGYRTFTVRRAEDGGGRGEVLCPATELGGHKTQCDRCRLCDGSRGEKERRRDIWAPPHGIHARKHPAYG